MKSSSTDNLIDCDPFTLLLRKLNEQFMHVVELTKEIRKLRQQIKPNNFHIEENNSVIHNLNTFNAENYLK